MTILLSWVVGVLFSISVYLMLSRQLMQWLFGVVILSVTANLLVFAAGRVIGNYPPFVYLNQQLSVQDISSSITQALILTAIVISFGLLTFMLALVRKIWHHFQTLDSDEIRLAEPVESVPHPGEHTHS